MSAAAPLPSARAATARLHIDWVACDGRGLCTELVPELLAEDPWGYPMPVAMHGRQSLPANGIPVPDHVMEHAEAAVAACPLMALRLDRA
jgi:ferredoxin